MSRTIHPTPSRSFDTRCHERRSSRRPGANKSDSKGKAHDSSSALSFDEDLKAKLAAHNRGVTKGRHTYEPSKGRVKDWKKVNNDDDVPPARFGCVYVCVCVSSFFIVVVVFFSPCKDFFFLCLW